MESTSRLLGEDCAARCPELVRATLGLISAKWVAPIYLSLYCADRRVRYAELQRQVGPITAKEFAKHLRKLEQAGLVARTVHPTVPPAVEYELTGRGRSLYPAFETLARWSLDNAGLGLLDLAGAADARGEEHEVLR